METLDNDEIYDKRYMNKIDKSKLNGVIKNNQYLSEYYDKIKNGLNGDEYLKATQQFLIEQH